MGVKLPAPSALRPVLLDQTRQLGDSAANDCAVFLLVCVLLLLITLCEAEFKKQQFACLLLPWQECPGTDVLKQLCNCNKWCKLS